MDQCNITRNRVKEFSVGYTTQQITSNSYTTCVNVIENNQTSDSINFYSTSSLGESIFKVTTCNYIRNKSPNDGHLILTHTDIFMSYCCIRENDIPYIFYAYDGTITFENSTTDNNISTSLTPLYKNTFISFENDCPYLILDNDDSSKNKQFKSNKDENEEENDVYARNNMKFSYLKFFYNSFAIITSLHSKR